MKLNTKTGYVPISHVCMLQAPLSTFSIEEKCDAIDSIKEYLQQKPATELLISILKLVVLMFVIPQKIKSGNTYITNEQIMATLQQMNARMAEIEKTFKQFMGELEHEVADCVEHKAVSSREREEIAELARMASMFS